MVSVVFWTGVFVSSSESDVNINKEKTPWDFSQGVFLIFFPLIHFLVDLRQVVIEKGFYFLSSNPDR